MINGELKNLQPTIHRSPLNKNGGNSRQIIGKCARKILR